MKKWIAAAKKNESIFLEVDLSSWNEAGSKKIISSNLQEISNVVSSDKESLIILRGADSRYVIPKSRVAAFIGDGMLVDRLDTRYKHRIKKRIKKRR